MKTPIRLLLLEDNRDDAELVLLNLQESNFDVTWQSVETRQQYRAALSPELDIILADYNLPGFGAPEALNILQELGLDIPFIVVTGSISEEVAVACIKQGADDYLLKDRLSRLGEAIRHALQQRDLGRAKRAAERNLRITDWAVNSSINAIVMTDPQGYITYTNQAFRATWCFESDEQIIGKPLQSLWQFPDQAAQIIQELQATGSVQGEMQSQRCDGLPITLQFSTSRVLDTDKKLMCLMGIFIDITEKKRAEAAKRESAILRIELEKERELRELKSRFISMIVHDFRNPLTSIQLTLFTLERYLDRLDEAGRLERIASALKQINRLNGLVEEVLILSKADQANLTFQPVMLDLNKLGETIFEEFSQQGTATHPLHWIGTGSPLLIYGDPELIHRALFNLLSNAIKYSPEGGTVDFEIKNAPDEISVSVSDQGIGISEQDLKYLFDPFHRGSNVGVIEGTGLGLAIVKHIAELHEGSITCQSALGHGTTFTLHLPHITDVTMANVAQSS